MSAIIRRGNFPSKISRQEFLTPFDKVFDDMLGSMFPSIVSDFGDDFFTKGSYPKVNVINHDDAIDIEAAIPGMRKEDINVEITDGVLTIQGNSNQKGDISDSRYVKREIKRSSFKRSFNLSENLDDKNVKASFDNGILTLKIPKLAPLKNESVTEKIEIN